jgi:hypothetical protein
MSDRGRAAEGGLEEHLVARDDRVEDHADGELGPQGLSDVERGRDLAIEHRQHEPEQLEPRVLW